VRFARKYWPARIAQAMMYAWGSAVSLLAAAQAGARREGLTVIRLLILLCVFWAIAGHRHFPFGMVIFGIVILALIQIASHAIRESSRRRPTRN
jgi:hypothetical protein